MKIFAASDLHGVVDITSLNVGRITSLDVNRVDVCVLAGDIAPLMNLHHRGMYIQQRWVYETFVPFMHKNKDVQFVFVAGNHDFWGEMIDPDEEVWCENAHYLRNSGCTINGIKFYGMPQVPPINGVWAFESSPEEMKAACEAIPDDTDVLITHTPPRVSGSDIDASKGAFLINGKQPHFGSSELTEAIERVQPQYLFCGHIHTGDHSCVEIGRTKCFNVSLLNEDYEQAYAPFIEDVDI